jgi:hypothetical protein
MSAFLDELKSDLRSRVPLVLWLVCAMSLAVSGPFGSYGIFSFWQRLLIWLPVTACAIATITLVRALVYGTWGLRDVPRGAILIAALSCLVICPPVYALANGPFLVPAVKGAGWAELILLVGSITLGISSLRHSIQPMIPATAPETLTETVESGPLPRLIERLDPDLRGKLQSISVRDHYVDVSTSLGVGSLLMRFSDAISEVWPVEGAQVHRSHWVAWDAVEAVEREGGKLFLRLPSGARIPVSRNHRDKLEARGLV